MSAELLRKAAEILHERAKNATPGPWQRNGWNAAHTPTGSCVFTTARHDDEKRRADADYIATMHPDVGLSIADVLDALAYDREASGEIDGRTWDLAIVPLARLIVGES